MARIFSINFLFNHRLYSALVLPRQTEGHANYAVRYLDGDMDAVFSEGKMVLSPSGVIESKVCGPQKLAEAFALSTKAAILKHLNGKGGSTAATKILEGKKD